MLTRRSFLLAGGASVGGVLALGIFGRRLPASAEVFPVAKSAAEWKAELTPAQYAVLREHSTERAFTSPLLHEKRTGVYTCAGCAQPLFSSEAKFDSKTGWPSFTQPISPSAIGTSEDRTIPFFTRTEVHCSRCGGHLGHVFEDGPPPRGERWCINGVALEFVAA